MYERANIRATRFGTGYSWYAEEGGRVVLGSSDAYPTESDAILAGAAAIRLCEDHYSAQQAAARQGKMY